PSQVGGFALMSHDASTEQFASQLAFALTDAVHCGGSNCTLMLPCASALNEAIDETARVHHAFMRSRLSSLASAASRWSAGASRSSAMPRHAAVMSSMAADAMPAKSATAWTATWLCALPPM